MDLCESNLTWDKLNKTISGEWYWTEFGTISMKIEVSMDLKNKMIL